MSAAELPACQTCRRPMRPGRGLIADYPGTVSRSSVTTCKPCAESARHIRNYKPAPARHPASRAELDTYLAARRQRLAKKQGQTRTA